MTKKNFIQVILSWIHALFLLYGFFPLFASMAQLEGTAKLSYCLMGLLLLIPIVLSWVFLRVLKQLPLYVLCSALATAGMGFVGYYLGGVFLYGDIITAGLFLIISIVLFVNRGLSRIRYGDLKRDYQAVYGLDAVFPLRLWDVPTLFSKPAPVHWAWFVIQYILGIVVRQSFYWHFIFYMLVVDVLCVFAFCYIERLNEFVAVNSRIANFPGRTIKKVHNFIFAIATLLLALFMVPAILYQFEPLTLIKERESVLSETVQTPSEHDYSALVTGDPMVPPIITEMNDQIPEWPWVGYLVKVSLFLMLAILVVVSIIGIIRFIRRASMHFAEEEEDEVIFLGDESADTKSRLRRNRQKEERGSINMQVRKKYKKLIRKNTKGTPSKYSSPFELETTAGLRAHNGTPSEEKTTVYHEIYEKARYSKEGASKELLSKL